MRCPEFPVCTQPTPPVTVASSNQVAAQNSGYACTIFVGVLKSTQGISRCVRGHSYPHAFICIHVTSLPALAVHRFGDKAQKNGTAVIDLRFAKGNRAIPLFFLVSVTLGVDRVGHASPCEGKVLLLTIQGPHEDQFTMGPDQRSLQA